MTTPAIIYLVIIAASLLISANQHGKPKTGNNSFWISLIAAIISLGLLFWGGFFS